MSPAPNRRGALAWTLSTPTTSSCQISGTDSIAVSPAMSKPRTQEKRGSRLTSSTAIGSRPAATRPVIPFPQGRLTLPTWVRSSPLVAARVSRVRSRSAR